MDASDRLNLSTDEKLRRLIDMQYQLFQARPEVQGREPDLIEVIQEKDNVNLPQHYARYKIEPIRFCGENGLDFFQANVVKYICRHDAKNGKEDLKKVIRYTVMLAKKVYNDDPNWWGADEALAAYLKDL